MAFKDLWTAFQPLAVNDALILRQVKPEQDSDSFFRIYCDADAMKYYQGYSKPPAARDWVRVVLQNQIKAFERRREYNWTIADANTDEALGRILLSDFQNNNTMANIGYFLRRDCWGKGIMTACTSMAVRFAFDYMKLERVFSTVERNNIASWRVLEKTGLYAKECFAIAFCFPTDFTIAIFTEGWLRTNE